MAGDGYGGTLEELADLLKTAGADLQHGDIDQAGRTLQDAGWAIQEYLEKNDD